MTAHVSIFQSKEHRVIPAKKNMFTQYFTGNVYKQLCSKNSCHIRVNSEYFILYGLSYRF